MFTGLVQRVGRVLSLEGSRLRVEAALPGEPIAAGESIAVNGACLTALGDGALDFDLSPETLDRTSLGALRPGSAVNLERALRLGDRLGGHFVLGHVDGLAELAEASPEPEGFWRLSFRVAEDHARLLIDKGSAALDGISLTVISPGRDRFEAAIIPHTWNSTNLHERRPGDLLNLELDMLAKHASRLLLPFQDEQARVEERKD